MAEPLLLLGSIDLSLAMKVAKDEGMDPAAPTFVSPEFSSSPFADGSPLISVSAQNREQAWPIIFRGADKNAMLAKQRQIMAACASREPVQFRDLGFDEITHFDVQFARFDVDYNYRRQAKNWLGGILRVWTKPYGTTGTSRVVGTLAAASGAMQVPISATVGGDVAPEVTVEARTGTAPCGPAGRIVGAAVVPSGYKSWIPVGSFIASFGLGLSAATGIPGNEAIYDDNAAASYPQSRFVGGLTLPASPYAGRNRVLGVVKASRQGRGFCVRAFDARGNALGPTAIAGRDRMSVREGFELVDLGIASVPTSRATSDFKIYMGEAPGRYLDNLSHPLLQMDTSQATTSRPGAIGGLIVLPEDTGYLLAIENSMRPRYRAWFGASGTPTALASAFVDDFGVRDSASTIFGAPVTMLQTGVKFGGLLGVDMQAAS